MQIQERFSAQSNKLKVILRVFIKKIVEIYRVTNLLTMETFTAQVKHHLCIFKFQAIFWSLHNLV